VTYPENKKPFYWLAFRRDVFSVFLGIKNADKYLLPKVMGKRRKR